MLRRIVYLFWKVICLFITLALCIHGFSPLQPAQAAICTVTNDDDSGAGTLRALLADPTCDSITFASAMTIHLANPLWIDTGRTVTIDGSDQEVNITDDNFRRVITVASGADATLQNITITQGSNEDYFVASEGAISESSLIPNFGTLRIISSTVNGKPTMSAGMVGSGIMNRGTLIVDQSTFTGHSALGGAAIYNDGYMSSGLANISVTNSTFATNTSWVTGEGDIWTGVIGGGGAITNFAGILTVTGNTFTSNTAQYAGGAIVGYYGENTLTNNTFSDNIAENKGGAVLLFGGALTNNTFYGNSAPNGGALFILNVSPMAVMMSNNILVNGTPAAGPNCFFETTGGSEPGTISGSNNLADDDSCGATFTLFPDLLSLTGGLGNHGGPTQTIPLLEGSPAIDAGDDILCPATDQRGVTRPQGAACDIGAYEFEESVIPIDYVISGAVYDDLNANGSRDAGEEGIGGAPVILALNLDQVPFNYLTAYSTADGSFQFNLTPPAGGLPAGFSVSIFVEPVTGYKITQLPAQFAVLTGNLTGMDIGVHTIVLTPTPAGFPDGLQGVAYNQTITVTGGDAPYTFTPSSLDLPAGLSYAFDEQLGTITLSGAPTESGEFLAHIDFNDANNVFAQVHEYFTIHPPMQFSPATLPNGSLDTAYSQTITVSGGIPPYAFAVGSEHWLPAGLTLDTSSGSIVISGTPSEAGQATLDVYVSDQSGNTIEVQRAFWIKTAPSLNLTSSLNPSLESQPVTFSLASTATVADWPAPWGQVTFKADGVVIPGCEGLWLEFDPGTEEPAPNPVTCTISSLAVGTHMITAELTALFGPYMDGSAELQGGQTVDPSTPLYQTAGFTAPVDLGGVLNIAKAGQMIPLKWQLLDAAGNPVTDLDPASVMLTAQSYACETGTSTDLIETYTTGTTLLQNLGNGYYQLNWKTLKSYVNTCRQLTLTIDSWTEESLTSLFVFSR